VGRKRQARRHQVSQLAGVIQAAHEPGGRRRQFRRGLHVLPGVVTQFLHDGAPRVVIPLRADRREHLDLRLQDGTEGQRPLHAEAGQEADGHPERAVVLAVELQHVRRDADAAEPCDARLVGLAGLAREDTDDALLRQRFLEQLPRCGIVDGQHHHQTREKHDAPHWQ